MNPECLYVVILNLKDHKTMTKKMSRLVLLFILTQLFIYSGIADEIKICKCAGSIKSDFATLNIDAEWDVEWPYKMDGTSSSTLKKIHKQICYDSFMEPILGYSEGSANEIPARADFAQVYLFKKALKKVSEREDSFCARSFDFVANLKINFVTDGYIGYTLKGLANEGGNGCHSYTIARVISLTTGKCLRESDFILTNKFSKLGNFIVKKSLAETKREPINSIPGSFFKTADLSDDAVARGSENMSTFFDNGNFMLEPEGIRWYIPPYAVYPGCAGVVDVLITWDELTAYFASKAYLNQFRKFHLTYKKIKRIQDRYEFLRDVNYFSESDM